jgi:Cd2+/Zn2+-exporting ATPase
MDPELATLPLTPSTSTDNASPPAATVPVHAAIRTGLCALFTIIGWLLGDTVLAIPVYVFAYLAGGAGPAWTALQGFRERQLGVDLLMIAAAIGAAIIGDWGEGAVLLFLFSLSGTLEAYASYRTTRSIESLIQLRPREASLVKNGEDVRVAVDALQIGDIVRVRPGERFPVDGEVTEGETWADEATLTGESTPIHKTAGELVFAGTINGRGSVLVKMTRAVADSTLEKIVRMVREAQAGKTQSQKFIESWQQPYVLAVFIGSALMFAGSWLFHDRNVGDAFYHSMVLLVVASPCAVVISSPAVMLSAIARAALNGVLFKGGFQLEMLGRVQIMAFDKTGTITFGKPRVTTVQVMDGIRADELLRLAAAVELHSEHHLAEAVVEEARRRGLHLSPTEEFESHTGLGVHAHVDRRWVGIGREQLFASHDIPIPSGLSDTLQRFRAEGQTALLVVVHDSTTTGGVIVLADQPRPDAAPTLAALKRLGVQQNIILTGDHEKVAQAVAKQVNADQVRASLLPDQKVVELGHLIDDGKILAMVGDGVNDAPALATAHVGIAMGGAGTDVALDVADVVLMRDDLRALPFAVWLSRQARRRVRQNLTFAFGVIVFLILASMFGLPLWLGVVGHEGSTVVVVVNGLRLLWEKPRDREHSPG